MKNTNLKFLNYSESLGLIKRETFFNEGQKVEAKTEHEKGKTTDLEAQKKVGEQLNSDLKAVLAGDQHEHLAEVKSPVLNEQQIKQLKEGGVKDVKLEKTAAAAGSKDCTALYFEIGVSLTLNNKAIYPTKMQLIHEGTVSIEVTKGAYEGMTVVTMKNEKGPDDQLVLYKEIKK